MVKYKNISNLDDESWFVTSSNQMKSCHVWKCVEFISYYGAWVDHGSIGWAYYQA